MKACGRSARPFLAMALWCLAGSFGARDLAAQLRPLDPFDWSVFDARRTLAVQLGGASYIGQRAALAGTEGRLDEVGVLRATVRLDRVAFDIGWTALRRFHDRSAFAPPAGGTHPPNGAERTDVGDFRLATIVRLWSDRSVAAALRFGTRLPTTDNEVGLERDQTDFFALMLGHLARDPLSLSLELGVGINGTRNATEEQSDVMLYAVRARYRWDRWTSSLAVVGQDDWHARTFRGNEDLREVRFGVRFGERRWLEASLIRGLTPYSPRGGVMISVGATL